MTIKNILINSADRNTGTSSNFSYQLLYAITNPTTIALETIQMFHTQYTIDARNNKLYWTDGASVAHTSTLTSGTYTASALASHIETVINTDDTNSDTYTVSFSTITGKITIACGSNFSLTFGTNTNNSVAYVIGFANTNKTGASTYTGENIVNLNTKYYTVHCNFVDNCTYQANAVSSSWIVPASTSWGDLIVYSPHLAKSFKTNQTEISSIQIFVKDDKGNMADLNGVDWSANFVVNSN
jgi:hypothetical protein